MPQVKPNPIKVRDAAARLPRSWLRGRARALLQTGLSAEEVARRIAALVDKMLDFERLVPAPFGLVLEAADGPVAYAIALPLVRAARRALVKAGVLV
jgi:hypothetical protein